MACSRSLPVLKPTGTFFPLLFLILVFALPATAAGEETPGSSGLDFPDLLAESIARDARENSLRMVVRENSWQQSPLSHDELARCVETDSSWNPDRSGIGLSDQARLESNPYGLNRGITVRFSGFFRADEAGDWGFAINAAGAGEIEIDGRVAASWYGDHESASFFDDHASTVNLAAGWHRVVVRYAVPDSREAYVEARFRGPSGERWLQFSTENLSLRTFPMVDGLLLVNRKNTRQAQPENSNTLYQAVEEFSRPESGFYGWSTVNGIDQDGNINGDDTFYTSRYEAYFSVDEAMAGDWRFAIDSGDAAELEIDGQAAVAWYGGHEPAGDQSHNATVTLAPGWHRLVLRSAIGTANPPLVRAMFQTPGDTDWRPLSVAELPLRSFLHDLDGDGLDNDLEGILGTGVEQEDSDVDGLSDFAEAMLDCNPVRPDSNNDGLADSVEFASTSSDPDGDGTANLWDDDNDNDGVVDGLDMSPFSSTGHDTRFRVRITTSGKHTALQFEVRPENPMNLLLNGQKFDWPYDTRGQMQDRDNSTEDITLVPMLELTATLLPSQEEVKENGIIIADDSLLRTTNGHFTHNDGFGVGDVLGTGTPQLVVGWDKDRVITVRDHDGNELTRFDSVFSTGDKLLVADVLGDDRAEILVFNEYNSSLYVYSGEGHLITRKEIVYDRESAVAAGDYCDDANVMDTPADFNSEVVVGNPATGKLWVFAITDLNEGYALRAITSEEKTFSVDDGLAMGDVDGDGRKEILVAHNVDDRLVIYHYRKNGPSFDRVASLDVDYDRSDALAAMDILPSDDQASPRYGEEIIVLKRGGGGIVYTEAAREEEGDMPDLAYSTGDGYSVSDFYGAGQQDIILASDTSNAVHVYNPRTRKAYVPLVPVLDQGTPVAFQGRMVYNATGGPAVLNADVRLVWFVVGKSDTAEDPHAGNTVLLAKYPDTFQLVGFSATEFRGESVALFYNQGSETEARDEVGTAYLYLQEHFLESSTSLEESSQDMAAEGLDLSRTDIATLSWDYERARWTREQLENLVNQVLPDGIYPVLVGGVSRFATIGLADILAENDPGDTLLAADLQHRPTRSLKSIKMNWYDTTTGVVSPLGTDRLDSLVDGWGLDTEDALHSLAVILVASMGQTGTPSYHIEPRRDALAYVRQLGTGLVRVVLAGKDANNLYQTTRLFLSGKATMPLAGLRTPVSGWGRIYKLQTSGSFFTRFGVSLETVQKVGRVFTELGGPLAVATAAYTFYRIGSATGWSPEGTLVALRYGTAQMMYLMSLTMIGLMGPPGAFIVTAIVVADVVLWMQDKETLSDKIVGWMAGRVDADLSPTPDFWITASRFSITDPDDDGLTVGDRLEYRFRATETMTRYSESEETDEERDMYIRDMRASILRPRALFRNIVGNHTRACRQKEEELDWWGGTAPCDIPCTKGRWYRCTGPDEACGELEECAANTEDDCESRYTKCLDGRLAVTLGLNDWPGTDRGHSRYVVDESSTDDRERRIWDFGAWLEPQQPTTDLAQAVQIRTELTLRLRKCDRNMLSGNCDSLRRSTETDEGIDTPITLHLDVLPATLEDFVTWSEITPLDRDKDGIADALETADNGPSWFNISGQTTDTEVYGALDAGGEQPDGTADFALFNARSTGPESRRRWQLVYEGDGLYAIVNQNNRDQGWPSFLTGHSDGSAWLETDSGDLSRWRIQPLRDDLVAVVNEGLSQAAGNRVALSLPAGYQADAASPVKLLSTNDAVAQPLWRITLKGGGTDSRLRDSDGDGLSDLVELLGPVRGLFVDAMNPDTDGDGLSDGEELRLGTDPVRRDTDGDGLDDHQEVAGWQVTVGFNGKIYTRRVFSNPLVPDSDGDGLDDHQEFAAVSALNPVSRDTDGDGVPDNLDSDPVNPPPGSVNSDGDDLYDVTETTGWEITVTAATGTETRHVSSAVDDADTDDDGLLDHQEYGISDPTSVDTDGDGLLDGDEIALQTDILDFDTDDDGLADGAEVHTYLTSPLAADTDSDGLNDAYEINSLGTDPLLADTDSDGLNDPDELVHGTSATNADTDGDTLTDGAEVNIHHTNPLLADSDADGLRDDAEIFIHHTDPGREDSDGDSLSDPVELAYDCTPFFATLDPLHADSDGDGLSDAEEVNGSPATSPCTADTDGDGLNDGRELAMGTDPNNPDTDGDTIRDGDEMNRYGTDPLLTDTDGDNLDDQYEINGTGTDPASADTDGDSIPDDMDPDTLHLSQLNIPQVLVLFDRVVSRQGAVVATLEDLLGENNVLVGTPADFPDLASYPYILMLGLPDAQAPDGSVGRMMDQLLDDETKADMLAWQQALDQGVSGEELTSAMIRSIRARFATSAVPAYNGLPAGGYGTMPPPPPGPQVDLGLEHSLIVMLSEPQPHDGAKLISMLVSLRRIFWENFAKTEWVPSGGEISSFLVNGITQTGAEISTATLRAPSNAGMAVLAAYPEDLAVHPLNQSSGLAAGESPLGNYVLAELAASNLNTLPPAPVGLQEATLRFYYRSLDLDRSVPRDGDADDIGDLNEETLHLYRWDDTSGAFVAVSGTLDTTNVTIDGVEYDGFFACTTTQLGLFALAGIPRPDTTVPGAPAVVATDPADGATGVAVDNPMVVTFSEPVAAVDLDQVDMDGAVVLSTVLSGNTLTITHDGLVAGATYRVSIPGLVVMDAAGNFNEPYSWGFTAREANSIPFANDDDLSCAEDGSLTVNVMDDHGHGIDQDTDGDPISIIAVNGEAAKVDVQVPGSSGGLFTLGADGSLSFTTNGDFDALPAGVEMETSMVYTLGDGLGSDTATVTVTVQGVNSRPVLDGEDRFLRPVAGNAGNDNGSGSDGDNDDSDNYDNPGDLVSRVIASSGLAFDADGDSLGIAVVGVDNSRGVWQYHLAGGGWLGMNPLLSDRHALLLPPEARIRFVPDARLNCAATSMLRFRLWDQSAGLAGDLNHDTTLGDGCSLLAARAVTEIGQVPGLPEIGDVDGDGIANCQDSEPLGAVYTDTDGDGMDDDWERFYFSSLTRASTTSDADGDRYSDLNEYRNWRDGILDPLGSAFDPVLQNAAGGENYGIGLSNHAFWMMVLPAITRGEVGR